MMKKLRMRKIMMGMTISWCPGIPWKKILCLPLVKT